MIANIVLEKKPGYEGMAWYGAYKRQEVILCASMMARMFSREIGGADRIQLRIRSHDPKREHWKWHKVALMHLPDFGGWRWERSIPGENQLSSGEFYTGMDYTCTELFGCEPQNLYIAARPHDCSPA